jgi:uncharacterized protein (TIGR02996 family)
MADLRGAFIEAVCAAPEDDAPRLVYADWLEDHGDEHDRARAEFIRLQCQQGRMAPDDPKDQPAKLAAALRAAHARTWRNRDIPWSVRGQCKVTGFQRGFWESAEVWFDADTYPVRGEQVAALLAANPFRSLRIFGGASDVAPALARCPQAGSLRRLEVEGDPHGAAFLHAADVAALAGSPHLAGLQELRLYIHEFGDEGARALAGSPHLRNLSVLRFSTCRIGDSGVEALAESEVLAKVTHLHLPYNDIGGEGALALVRAPHLGQLQVLELDGDDLGAAALEALRARFGERLRLLFRRS